MVIYILAGQDFQLPASLQEWGKAEGHEIRQLNVLDNGESLHQLWEVDLLLLFGWEKSSVSADARFTTWVSLLEKCGRPTHYGTVSEVLSEVQLYELSLKPRTNYRPVDCGYYDHFETAIVKRQPQRVRLSCFNNQEKDDVQTLNLLGTKTWRKEEFVEVEGYGWLRADWVDLVDVRLAGECSIWGQSE